MNTNQLSINIFLTEKFLGKPECDRIGGCLKVNCGPASSCKCDSMYYEDLFTPEGFFLLWEKAQKEEWWEDFKLKHLHTYWEDRRTGNDGHELNDSTINPFTFPTLLATYLGWKE